jgi:hypothetical protein
VELLIQCQMFRLSVRISEHCSSFDPELSSRVLIALELPDAASQTDPENVQTRGFQSRSTADDKDTEAQ